LQNATIHKIHHFNLLLDGSAGRIAREYSGG
jgi:hypothetical protein